MKQKTSSSHSPHSVGLVRAAQRYPWSSAFLKVPPCGPQPGSPAGFLGCSLLCPACKVARCEIFPPILQPSLWSYINLPLGAKTQSPRWCFFCHSLLLPSLFQLSLPSTFSTPEEIDEAFQPLNHKAGAQVQFSALSSAAS